MERNLEFGTVDLHFIREYVPLGKSLFEMCWFYMGIVQIALDPTPPVKRANMGKKCAQTILASLYTPPYGQCPYGNNTFHKGGSLSITAMTMTTVTTSTCC